MAVLEALANHTRNLSPARVRMAAGGGILVGTFVNNVEPIRKLFDLPPRTTPGEMALTILLFAAVIQLLPLPKE